MNLKIDDLNNKKLVYLDNPKIFRILQEFLPILNPDKITVITDTPEDIAYVRECAVKNYEERKLSISGHTVHFDGMEDQGRDTEKTKVLLPPGKTISRQINTGERTECLNEIKSYMQGAMQGRECFIRFFCLGPLASDFSVSALQITDSAYVGHSEDILYRSGYEQFKKLKPADDFFYFVHTAGKLDSRGNSVDVEKKRIYIDIAENRVLTVNSQYAGNTVGLKKLALRLGINRADQQGWLTEHMFIMGACPQGKNRKTYFAGAFPSACGKTSTAMIPGQTIVGDDIAYIKIKNKKPFAVNIEQGIFGIIEDVNPADDPVIYKALTTPRELIFSNILVNNGHSYWPGMGKTLAEEGENHSGKWKLGAKDKEGKIIPYAHKNARYTIRLKELENVDEKLDDANGVELSGIIYGGRDSDTSVPVLQSLTWQHGVFLGATIESETTAATLGQTGVRKFSPMANMDFLVIPLGKYIANHIAFGARCVKVPLVFKTNYFLKDEGKFLNSKLDKKIWLLWMEGRVHGEYKVKETPAGYIPVYEDLAGLFQKILNKKYSREDYSKQFSLRLSRFLEQTDRIEKWYAAESDIPREFLSELSDLRLRLDACRKKFKKDIIAPEEF
ncbi:MAG: phosphoenolpyruvate carboxykinase [Spirochaetes bacterium GWF1_41_5]|nr:MAG: phosphoenolpyruvate carboxykinase [Spirochaetes bacterium GWF1_41_5]HBE02747.1 phosphoenolpyruvate carboxykinase (GTP) [Spirochaetia bacterium]